MFERISYKKMAKQQLKGRHTVPVLITLVVVVIEGCFGFFMNYFEEGTVNLSHPDTFSFGLSLASESLPSIISLIVLGISGILTLSQTYVYIKMTRTTEKSSFNDFVAGFAKWYRGFLGMLWTSLWTFLWSCLFIIPGIVKAFAYSQIFFIIAENPNTSVRRAMQISKVITQGHKGDLFVMSLSFIGWSLLCCLSCGIGFLWLLPYINMSNLNAYYALKNQALANGKISPADFSK